MLKRILLALFWIVPTLAVAGPMDDAVEAYGKGDYARVLKIVRPLAEQGDPDAQKLLGRLYGLGKGLPRDFIRGCMWQNLAAFQQHEEDSACTPIARELPADLARLWAFHPDPDLPPLPSAAPAACPDHDPACARIATYLASLADVVASKPAAVEVIAGPVDNAAPTSRTILLIANGTVAPKGAAFGKVQVLVDGKPVGSAPTFDWRNSPDPAARSFNTVVAVDLASGRHSVSLDAQLLGTSRKATMTVRAGASLSVLSSTAPSVQSASLAKDTASVSTKSRGIDVTPILTTPETSQVPVVSFLSANVYGDAGDAMLGLSTEGATCPWTAEQTFAVQDMADQAEREAPMFVQATDVGASHGAPTGLAAVFPWVLQDVLDPVHFRVTKGSTLVSIEGPRIAGAGYVEHVRNVPCATIFYHCLASSHGYDFCPKVGERSVVAQAKVVIDDNSDGVLMIVASTIPTGDHDDGGGSVQLGLSIDGVDVGTPVTQELPRASVESARVLAAAYLADTAHPLAKGVHTIQAWMSGAAGSDFKWISVPNSLFLTYFD